MKFIALIATVALSSALPAAAIAQAGMPTTLFACNIGTKTVRVNSVGTQLIYHYGTGAKEEMSIVGDPTAGNVFFMTQRFAGIEQQLRFSNGEYSYIVYNMEGNGRTGIPGVSGLIVKKGTATIADKSCSHYTELSSRFDFSSLPEDDEKYSAM